MNRLAYWIPTALFALAMTGSGVANLLRLPPMLESMAHLGFPVYLTTILGTWKVLGAITLLAPKLPRLKEWAYAGFFFNLTGAAAAHLFSGDGVGQAIAPLVILGLGMASWWLRPEERRLG